ncbi:uncharacterized protein LOC130799268 [Amaranthus tricolor]|uniref:uncharacterized protein LOC130799268 n=1 Tax=Amaranthus tricolor TaxID=29722 RepID=UPI00258BA4B8|nr:uncharacterized protein LOC130799268 [Amaranthus tricolor]
MSAIALDKGGVFFLYGHGGTGQTFIWRTLCAAIRSRGDIVLVVASSGIASLLLPMGRTAHSRFGIPLTATQDSMCSGIKHGSDLTGLLQKTKLIIWDEAPMVRKYCFEALEKSMWDALRGADGLPVDISFGGKVVIFGGNCRHTPCHSQGTRQDIVFAAINSLRIDLSDADEIREFVDWILKIGDGKLGEPNDGEVMIDIPEDILMKNVQDPIASIVHGTYPNLIGKLSNGSFFYDWAVPAATNEIVCRVNDYAMSLIHSEEKVYLSSDSISKAYGFVNNQNNVFSVEFLNIIKCSGLPNHEIRLKKGVPIMLLRNSDQSAGLSNGTRLIVSHVGEHIIEVKILT